MDQGYLPFLYIVSQKMIPHFYVLGFGMEHWVLCNAYGTSAITLKWDMGILLTKVTHGVLLTVNSCIKVHLDLQVDKSPVVVKGTFFPRVVNPRYRIRGTNV
jgi:hypothetical protein